MKQDNGRYGITNLGALLIAHKLSSYPSLRKRILRVVEYNRPGNLGIIEDMSFDTGYALALPKAEAAIMSLLPTEEYLDGAFRKRRQPYPKQAVRELLSNTVIHQNLSDAISGPLVCIYSNRIVFSNPGSSLISTERILNAQPRTRNNLLAGLLRQIGLCEEGGSGWDIAVAACEAEQIAAPEIQSDENLGNAGHDVRRQRI